MAWGGGPPGPAAVAALLAQTAARAPGVRSAASVRSGRLPTRELSLDRIYTRAGDDGQTSLGDGERVSKDDARVWAYGSVDETGAAMPGSPSPTGLEPGRGRPAAPGAKRSVRPRGRPGRARRHRARPRQEPAADHRPSTCSTLEGRGAIATATRSSRLRLRARGRRPVGGGARVTLPSCRRAERHAVGAVERRVPVNPHALGYLLGVSDLLFVPSRGPRTTAAVADVLWQPGLTIA